ncbi:mediator complex, subunit Med20 [Aspergillus pseudodeflectus]|uniref:Mediator of RNA polymerase II transcription subunit 20 n=1 Tax=Aspergillus pseudodeflectus TaxID=176178 RepID=A0ABR4L9Y4_9EURO
MPLTGVFFIPSNPNASTALATIIERLSLAFAEEPALLGRWGLEHKLMRDTPSCLPPSASQRQATPKFMQFLSLSHYPHGFIYASQPLDSGNAPSGASATSSQSSQTTTATTPMIMTTVPHQSTASLYQHFVYACQPFWAPRHTVTVQSGMVYEIGDFRVRVGDVRQTQPAVRVRGTVVEIEWRGPSLVSTLSALYQSRKQWTGGASGLYSWDEGEDEENDDLGHGMPLLDGVEEADIDTEYGVTASLIREFWATLGVDGAREAILVPDIGKEVKRRLYELKQQGKQASGRPGKDDEGAQLADEDPDPDAGVDVARQYMEIFRFNR